jgi:hypothetical protein
MLPAPVHVVSVHVVSVPVMVAPVQVPAIKTNHTSKVIVTARAPVLPIVVTNAPVDVFVTVNALLPALPMNAMKIVPVRIAVMNARVVE